MSKSFGHVVSIVVCFLYLYQPFVDRKAVYRFLVTYVYGNELSISNWGVGSALILFEWLLIGAYFYIYWLDHPSIEQYKVNKSVPWPWKSPDPEHRTSFKKLHVNALKFVLKSHVFILSVLFAIASIKKEPKYDQFSVDSVPEWYVSAIQIVVSVLITETGFYWGHRLLHHPSFYYLHKTHHEFKDVTAIASYYASPSDYLATNLLPAMFGIIVFEMHLYTAWMYLMPILFNGARIHCGYAFPSWFNPFLALMDAERAHDMHHRLSNCNYGSGYYFWDFLMGTLHLPETSATECFVSLENTADKNTLISPVSSHVAVLSENKNEKATPSCSSLYHPFVFEDAVTHRAQDVEYRSEFMKLDLH
jgi:sterol desaturase/sphingolipid hydroxylase (fatty acid hydroxylase superfamily)